MDGSRFDTLARSLAGTGSRRGVLGGLVALGAGLIGVRATVAQECPPGRVYRPRVGCICRLTGRPPEGGVCPCPQGQSDTGDGQGCVCVPDCTGATCGDPDGCGGTCIVEDCPASQVCLPEGCGCEAPRILLDNGSCAYPCTDVGVNSSDCTQVCVPGTAGSYGCAATVTDETVCIYADSGADCSSSNLECSADSACIPGRDCHQLC